MDFILKTYGQDAFTLGLFDAPLPLGFNFRGAAAGMHAEGLGQWDPMTGQVGVSSAVYIGAEISLIPGFLSYSVPAIGVGIAAHVNMANPASFDPFHDLGFFFFVGIDSFRGSAKGWALPWD